MHHTWAFLLLLLPLLLHMFHELPHPIILLDLLLFHLCTCDDLPHDVDVVVD